MIFRCLCFTVSRTIQCSISESPLNFLLNSVSVSRYASFFLGLGLGVPCLFQNSSTYVLFFQGLFLNMLRSFLVCFLIGFDFSTGPGLGMLCSFYNCSHVYFILSRSVLRYALFSIGMLFFRLLKKDLSLYFYENFEMNQENYLINCFNLLELLGLLLRQMTSEDLISAMWPQFGQKRPLPRRKNIAIATPIYS